MLQIKIYSKLYKIPALASQKALGFLGSRSKLGNGCGRGDCLGVDQQMQDGGLAACDCAFERGSELLGFFDALTMAAKSARVGREIRVFQLCRRDTTRVMFS